MRTTNWDALAAAEPLDRQAAVCGAADGEGGEADIASTYIGGRVQWPSPPACDPLPPGLPDLTGHKVGRLTVVSHFGKKPGGNRRWLVRCSCSLYEIRRQKSLIEPAGAYEEACGPCAVAEARKRALKVAITGRFSDGSVAPPRLGLNTTTGARRLKEGAA